MPEPSIRSFVQHKPTCAADSFDTGLCDCGLRDALSALEQVAVDSSCDIHRLQVARIEDSEIIGRWMVRTEKLEKELEAMNKQRERWRLMAERLALEVSALIRESQR
jgi:hypothetical protein